jgi:hypothetical protein
MKKSTTVRGLALLCLMACLAAFPALFAPAPAAAYGVIETEDFYSDPGLTMHVGRCVENSCRGTYVCSGTITNYSKTTVRGCA